MPTEPNIILQAGQIQGPDLQAVMSMFAFAQKVQETRRQNAARNALTRVFLDPNSVDPKTNLPTSNAIRQIMAVDPETGIKLQDMTLEQQVKRIELEHGKTEVGKSNFDFMSSAAGIGYDAYDEAKRSGRSEADAIAAGQAARNEAAKNNGGVIGDDVAEGIISKPFDPAGAKALAGANKEWVTQKHDQAIEDVAAINAGLPVRGGQASSPTTTGDPFAAWATKMDKAENATGDRGAQNPLSSATGDGQFINSTWLQTIKAERPELAKSLSDSQLLALRSDPAFSQEMTVAHAKRNAEVLTAAGIPVTGTSLAIAHRLGAGQVATVMHADPQTPMSSLVSAEALKANPTLANQTAGQYVGGLTTQFGAAPLTVEDTGGSARLPITGGKGWQVLTDPSNKDAQGNSVQYRYNPNTAVSTTLDGQPYKPGGAQKIGGAGDTPGPDAILSGDQLDYAAQKYRVTGVMPSMGMGSKGPAGVNRANIMKRAEQLGAMQMRGETLPSGAMVASQDVSATSTVKGDTASLASITKLTDWTESFEATALKNMGVVESLMAKGEGTAEGPIINRWLQAGRRATGDPDVAALDASLNTVTNEYAKIMSGSTGAMAATEGARAEAHAMVNSANSPAQIQKVFQTMRRDMENRKSTLEDRKKDIQSRLKGAGGTQNIATPANKADYDALSPGTHYRKPTDAEGTFRVKP